MSAIAQASAAGGRRRARSVPDRLLGAAGVGMVLLAIVLLLRGGAEEGAPLAGPPSVALLAPAAGAVLDGPLALEFTIQQELQRQPAGWGVGGYHLHLQLDGLELMPGAADVQPIGSGTYRWTVGALETGPHRLQLYWSDARHVRVEGGESEVVEVEVR